MMDFGKLAQKAKGKAQEMAKAVQEDWKENGDDYIAKAKSVSKSAIDKGMELGEKVEDRLAGRKDEPASKKNPKDCDQE